VTPRIVTDMQKAEQEKARLERTASLPAAETVLTEPAAEAEAQRAREEKSAGRRPTRRPGGPASMTADAQGLPRWSASKRTGWIRR
jgi:hypothetical protein